MTQFTPQETLKVLYAILDIDQKITGMEYEKVLVRKIAEHLNVKYVFIGHAIMPERKKVQTDIVWAGNDYHENFIYDLAGTPCENVLTGKRVCVYKKNVIHQFPEDKLLVQRKVESYIGAPVLTKEGELLGLLVLLDDKAIDDEQFISAVVELITMRVDREMERYHIEEKLKDQVEKRTVDLEKANTELKKALHKLEDANHTKDKFFSIIAHDLTSPFNVILSFSNLLLEYFDRYSREEIKDMVEDIFESSQSLHDLLENLLQWSMSQTDRLEVIPQTTNLNELISNIFSLMHSSAEKKKIRLSSSLPENMEAFFDKEMITTVTRNLLSNAIKFTHPEGEVKVQGIRFDSHIEISVEDNGVGICAEGMKSLFRIDVKHSTKGTSGEEGTGLGIILCREFIEKNGGTFHVESEPGEGSTFTFTLPISA